MSESKTRQRVLLELGEFAEEAARKLGNFRYRISQEPDGETGDLGVVGMLLEASEEGLKRVAERLADSQRQLS